MLTKEAADQFDCRARGATALVEEWIELDDVDGANQPAIMQQFHDQMRLPIGRPAGHRGADTWREAGIEKVDIKADMQDAVMRAHLVDDTADQHPDTEFVNRAHVGDADAAVAQHRFLGSIERAYAEKLEPVGIDGRAGIVAEQAVKPVLSAQE